MDNGVQYYCDMCVHIVNNVECILINYLKY